VGALGTAVFPASDHLLTHAHFPILSGVGCSRALEGGPSEDLQASQTMLIEIPYRVEQIAVKGHEWRATFR
jgi:hypothetical protein